MLNSIIKSKRIIGKCVEMFISTRITVPNMSKIIHKSFQELRNLQITKVEWCDKLFLGFTLSDGQTCNAGQYNFNQSHVFDPAKKTTCIETIIEKNERQIL